MNSIQIRLGLMSMCVYHLVYKILSHIFGDSPEDMSLFWLSCIEPLSKRGGNSENYSAISIFTSVISNQKFLFGLPKKVTFSMLYTELIHTIHELLTNLAPLFSLLNALC